jgi:hypothetical protein
MTLLDGVNLPGLLNLPTERYKEALRAALQQIGELSVKIVHPQLMLPKSFNKPTVESKEDVGCWRCGRTVQTAFVASAP